MKIRFAPVSRGTRSTMMLSGNWQGRASHDVQEANMARQELAVGVQVTMSRKRTWASGQVTMGAKAGESGSFV